MKEELKGCMTLIERNDFREELKEIIIEKD